MSVKHIYAANLVKFTQETTIYDYIEEIDETNGDRTAIFNKPEHVPAHQVSKFLKEKIAIKAVDQINLIGPLSYTENIRNQLYSSTEFTENPIKIELMEGN